MTEIEDEAAEAAAVEVVAVTTRDVAPGTENARADSKQLVVDSHFFIFFPLYCLFVKILPKLQQTNGMVPEFETVTALKIFFCFSESDVHLN